MELRTKPASMNRSSGVSRWRLQFRYAAVATVVVACVLATVWLFDWTSVWHSIRHMHIRILLGGGIPLIFVVFVLRALRWLTVLGIKPTQKSFWQSFGANGAALGLASVTPFLLGELIKIRLIPKEHGDIWRLGASAFFVERVMDLSGVLGLGLSGLAIHFGVLWAAPLGPLLPLFSAILLNILSAHIHRLPSIAQPYLEAFCHGRRIMIASLLTVPIWISYSGMLWISALSMNIHLHFGQVATLLGGVTLAVAATMVPGGLGVSELGSRGIMLWLGASVGDAESTAIALRMLTPLIFFSGMICMAAMFRRKQT